MKNIIITRGARFIGSHVVLSEKAIVAYKVDKYYSPECDRGIAFNDKFLNIDWKVPSIEIKLSKKDRKHPIYEKATYFNFKEKLNV